MDEKSWVWVLNSIDKCRETAYHAKNEKFQDYWHGVADAIEEKYWYKLHGQPWLRTYDGKLN